MTAEKMEEFSFVLTEEFQKVVGFSAEELASWFLADTVDRIKATECAMRLLYPSEGPKAIARHFEEGDETAKEWAAAVDYPEMPLDKLIRDGIRGFILEVLWATPRGVDEDDEEEFLAKYQTEKRGKRFSRDISTMLASIYSGHFCWWELGNRLQEKMHAVESIALRDGVEDVRMQATLHAYKIRPSGIQVPVTDSVSTGEDLKNECLASLMNKLKKSRVTLLWDDEHTKQEIVDRMLVEEIKPKLMGEWDFRTTIHKAMSGDLKYLPRRAKHRIIDEQRRQERERKRFESYDDEVQSHQVGEESEHKEGFESHDHAILAAQQKAWQETNEAGFDEEPELTKLEMIEERAEHDFEGGDVGESEITKDQIDALDKELNEIGRKIFLYRYHNQEIIGYGEGKAIAEAVGYAESTVSKYLKLIKEKAPKIQRIISG